MNDKGQFSIANVAVSVVVVFVVVSLGMTIVSNVQGTNTADPNYINVPFNSIWPLAVTGAAIISVILAYARLRT